MTECVRLFIGNLVPPITDAALTASLSKFGDVRTIERNQDRCFAHVSLQPREQNDITKCISILNQTRWCGTVLRVEVASEHYLTRLEREWKYTPVTSKPVPVDDVDSGPPSFTWKGKRVVFRDDAPNIVEKAPQHDHNTMMTTRTVPKGSSRFEATLDLFGIGGNDDDQVQSTHVESKPHEPAEKKARKSDAEISAKLRADKEAMMEIGDDVSKIDVEAERNRALNVLMQVLSKRADQNVATETCSLEESFVRFRRKSLHKALSSQVMAERSDICELHMPLAVLHGSDADKNMAAHRRKGAFRKLCST